MDKIKVGFGPKTTANSFQQSGVKIAAKLNEDQRFTASTFGEIFDLNELLGFDVLVFIKILPDYSVLKQLKQAGKILILDYQDMFLTPAAHEINLLKKILKRAWYLPLEIHERRKFKLIDCCFVASKESERVAKAAGLKPQYLFRQIYNDWHEHHPKQHSDKTSGLTIIWTGVPLNIPQNKEVEPVLKRLCEEYDCRVVYLTDKEEWDGGWIQHKRWSLETWEKDLLEGDIAFRWWSDSNNQRHKDSNKIISYMAAGLPVVCKPTESDRAVIRDGETGFFADTPEEFAANIEKLIRVFLLRKDIGFSAHREAWMKYSLTSHVNQIKEKIQELISEK